MKVVLITGCSSGIGEALAKAFKAEGGYRVFASARRLDSLRGLEALGIETVQLDVCSETSIKEAVASVLSAAGRIDVLVNNAGEAAAACFGGGGGEEATPPRRRSAMLCGALAATRSRAHKAPAIEIPDELVRSTFETNLFGTLAVIRAVVPAMAAAASDSSGSNGLVVNVASVKGLSAVPFDAAYCATKAAVVSLSDALRLELAPLGVRVVCVMPGGVQSNTVANSEVLFRVFV